MNPPISRMLAAGAAALALAACDRAQVDRTQQKLAEAGEKTQQTLSETSEKLQPKIAAAGDRISEAGSKVAADVKEAVRRDDDKASVNVAPEGSRAVTTTITTGSSTQVTGLPERTQAAFNDTAITTAVKAGFLKDPGLSAIKIDVDTREGVVVLNGVAADAGARDRATQIAQGVKGVREVRNHLTVKQG